MAMTRRMIRAGNRIIPVLAVIFSVIGGLSGQTLKPDSLGAAIPARIGGVVAEYAIQAGAFTRHDNAIGLSNRLHDAGFDAVIYENLLDGKNILYLVWVGRYVKPEDAAWDLKKIEELTGVRGVLRERMLWKRR